VKWKWRFHSHSAAARLPRKDTGDLHDEQNGTLKKLMSTFCALSEYEATDIFWKCKSEFYSQEKSTLTSTITVKTRQLREVHSTDLKEANCMLYSGKKFFLMTVMIVTTVMIPCQHLETQIIKAFVQRLECTSSCATEIHVTVGLYLTHDPLKLLELIYSCTQ
jgi:hypothetical protein